jgi:hypothetical protein
MAQNIASVTPLRDEDEDEDGDEEEDEEGGEEEEGADTLPLRPPAPAPAA